MRERKKKRLERLIAVARFCGLSLRLSITHVTEDIFFDSSHLCRIGRKSEEQPACLVRVLADETSGSLAKWRCALAPQGHGDARGGDGEDAAATAAAESKLQASVVVGEEAPNTTKRARERGCEWWRRDWWRNAHPGLPFIGAGALWNGVASWG